MDLVFLWLLFAILLFSLVAVLKFVFRNFLFRKIHERHESSLWEVIDYNANPSERPSGAMVVAGASEIEVIGFASRGGKSFLSSSVPGQWYLYMAGENDQGFLENAVSVFGAASENAVEQHLGYLHPSASESVNKLVANGYEIFAEPTEIGWHKVSSEAYLKINVLAAPSR